MYFKKNDIIDIINDGKILKDLLSYNYEMYCIIF